MKKDLSRRSFIRCGIECAGGMAVLPLLKNSVATNQYSSDSIFSQSSSELGNETIKTIESLRTIHGDFSDRQVPEKDLELILDASVRAANASAMQTYSIIVVKNKERIRQLTGYQGSRLLLYCVDYNRLIDSAKHLGYDYYPGTIVNFITGSMSTMLAAQTAVIAARSLGIDSLLTNGIHRGDMERVWKIVELPEKSCFPLIALILGYPNQEPPFKKGRLKGKGVIHYEKYHSLTKEELDEIVQKYDDTNLHLGETDDWGKYGFKHYLDWLFAYWLKEDSHPPAKVTQMLTLLKKSGFVELQKE